MLRVGNTESCGGIAPANECDEKGTFRDSHSGLCQEPT